jgi:hypothetical protein
MKGLHESLPELRRENQRLQHLLTNARSKLAAAEQKADTAMKSAADAWSFARAALLTGRRGPR